MGIIFQIYFLFTQRSDDFKENLIKFYPEYVKTNEGEIFTGTMKHGIADSVALGAPAPAFTDPKAYDVLEIEAFLVEFFPPILYLLN